MKLIFRISLLVNLVLLLVLVASSFNRHAALPEAGPVAAVDKSARVPGPPAMATPTSARGEPAPFRWNQLDASDYHIYVKNLRSVGCPEPSVRAIVTADVSAVYDQRRWRLEQKLAALDGGTWSNQLSSIDGKQSIAAELQQLPAEKTATIEDLLGLTSGPVAAATDIPPVTLPLALQTFDLKALNLDAGQIQALQDLRQRFLDQTGGTPPNPSDAVAMARWQKAQAESDDLMAGFLGSEAFQNMQLQALANGQAEKAGPK